MASKSAFVTYSGLASTTSESLKVLNDTTVPLALVLLIHKKSAEAGNTSAMALLAFCYSTGTVVSKDIKKAFDLATKAAELGNSEAMELLGLFYELGELNNALAEDWYLKAIDAGSQYAQKLLNNLRNGYHN